MAPYRGFYPHQPFAPSRGCQLAAKSALLTFVLAILLLLGLSSLHVPSSTSERFQLPGLLPSHYPPPPPTAPAHPLLQEQLSRLSSDFQRVCKRPFEPVHLSPGVTRSQEVRYRHLLHPQVPDGTSSGRYLIVSNIRQISSQLPDLLSAILVLLSFLGPDRLGFSILEGPSDDCTPDVLESVLEPLLEEHEVYYRRIATREKQVDFDAGNRIEILAGLRNRALAPLWEESGDWTAVVMFNDVFLHAADVLELLHQHVKAAEGGKETGITTGTDWWKKTPEYYYDIWVGRTIDTGDLFYPVDWPWWTASSDLFHSSPSSKAKYDTLDPLPAYSSWNGLAVLSPAPFLLPHNARFRRSDTSTGECAASECTLIAGDFWKAGYGRIQVVPSVQLGYEGDVAREIVDKLGQQKADLGWVDGVPPKGRDGRVQWVTEVRCQPWPEGGGLGKNVWKETRWVDPFTGLERVKA